MLPVSFHSETHEVYEHTDLDEILQFIYREFSYNIDEFQKNGSGWIVKDLLKLDTTVLEFDPLRASGKVELPKKLRGKKVCTNVENKDDFCFLFNAIAGIHQCIKDVLATKSNTLINSILTELKSQWLTIKFQSLKK